mmetsp:Transcript_9712/g.12814  ORF Transcript_9712/g.12814 Transcript_9712/m.12814 type:complete len:137 (+) Transcript_9712:193-603(+)
MYVDHPADTPGREKKNDMNEKKKKSMLCACLPVSLVCVMSELRVFVPNKTQHSTASTAWHQTEIHITLLNSSPNQALINLVSSTAINQSIILQLSIKNDHTFFVISFLFFSLLFNESINYPSIKHSKQPHVFRHFI